MDNPEVQVDQTRSMRRNQSLYLIQLIQLIGSRLGPAVLLQDKAGRAGHFPDGASIGKSVLILFIELAVVQQERVPEPRRTVVAREPVLLETQVLLEEGWPL
jgi:hypothetical protein